MEENTILRMMINQHGLLETLFSIFKEEIKAGPQKAKSYLSEFAAESKKHFFVEEETIFTFLAWNDPAISEIIERVKREHIIMNDKLAKILEDLSDASGEEIEIFYRLLTNHRKLEENDLYPVLDKRLNDMQKKQIIARANKIHEIK